MECFFVALLSLDAKPAHVVDAAGANKKAQSRSFAPTLHCQAMPFAVVQSRILNTWYHRGM